MISKLSEAFGFDDEDLVEQLMLEEDVISAINHFFSITGPTRILVTVEERAPTPKGKGEQVEDPPHPTKLKVHLKGIKYLPKTAVYFMKVKKDGKAAKGGGGTTDDNFSIDPNKINDGTLSFGIIRAPLESLEAVMRCVYKPLISDMNTDMWGQASQEQKTEFIMSIDMFTRGLQESIRSISGGLDLKKPDETGRVHGQCSGE